MLGETSPKRARNAEQPIPKTAEKVKFDFK